MSSAVMFTPVSSSNCRVPSLRRSILRTVALFNANFWSFTFGGASDFFAVGGFGSLAGFCSAPFAIGSRLLAFRAG